MDVDAFVARNQYGWARLQELSRRARRPDRLSPDELEELLGLYHRTSAQLSRARTEYATDQSLIGRLTMTVAEAHGVVYGERETSGGAGLRRFVVETFPAAMWRIRRFIVIATALTLLPWAVMTIWLAVSPAAFDATGDSAQRAAYIDNDFEDYYSSEPATAFASEVFTNNVRVAVLAFAAGVLVCVVTVGLLVYNGANGGMAGGLFTHVGQWERFWGLILPHGLLELSGVIIAGAAGLRVGWTIIDPGDRPRAAALAEEARPAGAVLLGLVAVFAAAGSIEGFVTGQPWPTVVRVGIGAAGFLAFWGYVLVLGPRAQSRPEAFSSR